jgi:phosphate transport system protein
MSQQFVDHLENLRSRVARMTALVQQAVEQAAEAVSGVDARLARAIIEGDGRIDDEEVKIEKAAIDLLALYQPAAGDLRMITTIIKVDSDFERIADCAVNIAQHVQSLATVRSYEPPRDLTLLGHSVVQTLRDAIKAFNLLDESLALQVLRGDDVVDALYHQIVQDLIGMIEANANHAKNDLSNIMIAKNMERIGDHCTNIGEAVIYVSRGKIVRHLDAQRELNNAPPSKPASGPEGARPTGAPAASRDIGQPRAL